jgi:hypothetical protein
MIGKGIAFLTAVVIGIAGADVLIHPAGVTAAAAGAKSVEVPAINGLLGTTT